MAYYYNKDELKNSLEIEQVYDLLDVLGGNPSYSGDDVNYTSMVNQNGVLVYSDGTNSIIAFNNG